MTPTGRPRLVVRHGALIGSVSMADKPIRFVASTEIDLRSANRAIISHVSPSLDSALDDSFDDLRVTKLRRLEDFWRERGGAVVNEAMVEPVAIVEMHDRVEIRYDAGSSTHFDTFMAVHELVGEHAGDLGTRARLFDAVGGLRYDGASLPTVAAVCVGANVVRIVESAVVGASVAVFTASGPLSIDGSETVPGSLQVLAATGGAVCPDLESSPDFAALDPANRELREETAIGLLGGVSRDLALVTQDNGQLATVATHDLRDVPHVDFRTSLLAEIDLARASRPDRIGTSDGHDLDRIEKSFIDHGLSFEFFSEVRELATDAAEAERYIAIPLTREAVSAALLHPRLRHRSWVTLMLVALAEDEFGGAFADEVVESMADRAVAGDVFGRLVDHHGGSRQLIFLAEQF